MRGRDKISSTFYNKYSEEWERMTLKYEYINSHAKTITRMATPEETKHYMELLEKDKPYAKNFQRECHCYRNWEKTNEYKN